MNSVYDWLSDDTVRFKIEVGVEEKCMYKNVTLNTRKMAMPAASLAAVNDAIMMTYIRFKCSGQNIRLGYPSNLLFECSVSTLAMACRVRVDHHQNQWGLCDALFSNYFEDLLLWLK